MTPKEKAFELTEKFFHLRSEKMSDYSKIYWPTAKMCALISVNFLIEQIPYNTNDLVYWDKVKQEIENL